MLSSSAGLRRLEAILNSVGNPRDQMTRYTEFVTILNSASGRILYNLSIHTEWNLFKYSAEYAENQALSDGVSSILRSGLILENIGRTILVSIRDPGQCT